MNNKWLLVRHTVSPWMSRNKRPQCVNNSTDLFLWICRAKNNDRPTNQQREQNMWTCCKLPYEVQQTKPCNNVSHASTATQGASDQTLQQCMPRINCHARCIRPNPATMYATHQLPRKVQQTKPCNNVRHVRVNTPASGRITHHLLTD